MPVPRHLEEAAVQLEAAERRMRAAQEAPPTLDSMRDWLAALTDYAVALSDVHRFTNESVHEKLHEIAGRAGVRPFPDATAPHEP